ncbi:MAG: hypothetical protein U1E67_07080 [Hyphomicrobiales bacterium]
MRKVLLDPAVLISVALAAINLFVYFFVWEWNYYDPSSAFVFAILGQLPLYGLSLIWFVLTVILVFARWKTQRWLTLVPVAVMLSPLVLGFFISGTTLWVDYNFAKFRDDRLAYARSKQPAINGCAAAIKPVPHDVEALSLAGYPPEIIQNSNGTYVVFRTFEGIPDGFAAFLYAPALGDPMVEVPELYLQFADLYDREACVYRVGNF